MKIAVIGNNEWQNRRKLQEVLQKLKLSEDDVTIVGAGGAEGANHMVRKYALEFGLKYEEYTKCKSSRLFK